MRLAAIVFGVALLLYVATACRSVPPGDGGELIAAADCLGVAHPPGYPLYTALGWLVLRLPLGEPAWRMNLLSSLFGAATCATAAWLLARATGSPAAAIAGSLALAVSSTFWWVAGVAEVYTLHLFLMSVLLAAAHVIGAGPSEPARARALIVAACALGLGLAHHPTIVLAIPAVAVLAWPRTAHRGLPAWSLALAVALVVALPVALELSLLLRARADPAVNWGQPRTLAALWLHASAAAYRHFDLGWAGLARGEAWLSLGRLAGRELGLPLLPLAALGLLHRHPLRWGLAALIGASALFGMRYAAEDIEVFYLPAFLGLALAAGAGIAVLRRHASARVRALGLAAAATIVLVPAVTHARARQLAGFTAVDGYGRDVLGTLPPRGVLFVETDEAFPLLYHQQVLAERPDVTIYHRAGVLFRDLVPEMRLAQEPGEPPGAYRIRVERTFAARELARPDRREVCFLGWPGYDPPSGYRLEPIGLLQCLARSEDRPRDVGAVWRGYHESDVREQAARTDDAYTTALAAMYALAHGERALFLGDRQEAYARFDEAGALADRTSGIHNYVGTVYGRLGDYPRAIACFRRALEITPHSILAWNNLARAHTLAADAPSARRALERSLALVPGQPDAQAALAQLPPR